MISSEAEACVNLSRSCNSSRTHRALQHFYWQFGCRAPPPHIFRINVKTNHIPTMTIYAWGESLNHRIIHYSTIGLDHYNDMFSQELQGFRAQNIGQHLHSSFPTHFFIFSKAGDADAVLPSVAETKRLQNLLPGVMVRKGQTWCANFKREGHSFPFTCVG